MEQFLLPDGGLVGTGCIIPAAKTTVFYSYASMGPMFTRDELIALGKQPQLSRGVNKFDVSYIKNQRNHGSCNGFAGAAALTKARVRRGLERVDLSGAYLYSLINGGMDQGSMLEDGMNALQKHGCASEMTVGWDQIYPRQYDKAKANEEASRNKAFECYALTTEIELLSALAAGFDTVVAVHVTNSFMNVGSDGVAGGSSGPGNHAVSADGFWYDESRNRFITDGVNSWGTTYGREGRMGLVWDIHFRSTTRNHLFYAIRSSLDDPNAVNPPVRN